MRIRFLTVAVMSLPLFVAACATDDDGGGPTPYDDEFPVQSGDINEGAPDNDSLPDDNKADAVYPAKFSVQDQSPVKSQGSRGVCSIFASIALVENVYIKAGMPVAEADFSEQHLQWSSKVQQGAFRNTEGSSANENLAAVKNYGTVKEAVWPYQSSPWSASNDPACTGGESLPTKCYTNGEPPAAAATAQKYKIPATRYINTNSMKAHIHGKKTGVNVGMTFFYQSWNHRRSELPISTALWKNGVVTYPNAKDKEVSLAKRAGHAIHIIGWDDNMEVESRDAEGKPILVNGVAKKEKGFWLFKNSWGTGNFGIDNEYGDGYGWLSYQYVKEYGSAVAGELPTLVQAREVCDDGVGLDEDGDGQENCDDSDCRMHPACTTSGGTSYTYTSTGGSVAIPDNNVTGASSTINVSDTGTIADAKLTLNITHTYRGDLVVTLTKGTDTITISDRAGGSADNLTGEFPLAALQGKALAGAWTLKVTDRASQDVGNIVSWGLAVTTE